MAKRTVQSNHGAHFGGEIIHNGNEHGLPDNRSTVFEPYGAINNKLDNGQVFLINHSTQMPVIAKLEITANNTAKWKLNQGQNLMFLNALDAALNRVQVPKPYGVVRDEPVKDKESKPDENKKEILEEHVFIYNVKPAEDDELPEKHNVVMVVMNTSQTTIPVKQQKDVIEDAFTRKFKAKQGDEFKVYAIASHLNDVKRELNFNRNLIKSEDKNNISALKETHKETRSSDGAILHHVDYVVIEPPKIEIVDVLYVTGAKDLILLTQQELTEIELEEKEIQGAMQCLSDAIKQGDGAVANQDVDVKLEEGQVSSPIQKAKVQAIKNLEDIGAFDKTLSLPTKLTEIKRLKGGHRTWVRSDKIKKHSRTYKMDAKDRKRSKGWLTDDGIDGNELKKAITSQLAVKFKSDIFKFESGKDNVLNQLHTEYKASIDKEFQEKTGFDASAEAQFMRFAAVAGAAVEFNPKDGVVAIQAEAAASFDLAKGEIKAEQVFPVNSQSEIKVGYVLSGDNGRETKQVNLGHLQAKLTTTLSGSAGASVLLAANVAVDCRSGIPKLKGKHIGAGGKAEAFAGVRAGCEVKGSLSWSDVLLKYSDWKQLCAIGQKVEGAAGIGAEGNFTFGFDNETGKFLLRAHAGLVIGVGAAGSFALEVDPKATLTMVHFMYEALRGVDYRRIKLFDKNGFTGYSNLCLLMITQNIHQWDEAMDQAKKLTDKVISYFEEWDSDQEKEKEVFNLANNILESSKKGEASALLHSPPEAKGMLLDLLLFDPSGMFEWPKDDDIKRQAIALICKTIQGGREYNEIIVRMNSNGNRIEGTEKYNSERIRKSLGLGLIQWDQFENTIHDKVAPTGAPVKLDPVGACNACGIA
jgi:hypothetical protein